MKALLPLPCLVVLGFLVLAGCGRPDNAASSGTAASSAPASGRAIEITGNDTMKFNLTEIRAKPGEALEVTLVNIGTMPKFSMGHNWVLLAAGTDAMAYANAAATAAKTDYLPESHKGQDLAATKLLGPKERDTVRFKAPAQPGRYIYICSFPGHFQVGMKGELIVE